MPTTGKSSVIVELHDLVITDRKDDRFGRVVTTRSLNEDDLVKIAAARGTELNQATLKAAFESITQVAIEQISNGASVRFGLSYYNLLVSGIFIGDHARWDPAIHSLRVNSTPVGELRDAVKSVSVEVRGRAATNLTINLLVDVTSGEENKRLTPGGGVNLSGNKIRIAGNAKGVGISLINQGSNEEIPVPMNAIMVNEPSRVSFVVPSTLPPGDYKLSLTTQYTTAINILKEARTYLFDCILNVA
jgi:hypothetical protein